MKGFELDSRTTYNEMTYASAEETYVMNLEHQWCDHPRCKFYGKVGAGNVRVFSSKDRRYYCTVCRHTWSANTGTAFEGLRCSRLTLTRVVEQLSERASLRATGRLTRHPVNTILDWLERTGKHAATVNQHLIQHLHVTYAQVDELWTFVKKTRAPSAT